MPEQPLPIRLTQALAVGAVYELGVNEIMVIGHSGCGVQMQPTCCALRERGVSRSTST